jgi:hypothetical protein
MQFRASKCSKRAAAVATILWCLAAISPALAPADAGSHDRATHRSSVRRSGESTKPRGGGCGALRAAGPLGAHRARLERKLKGRVLAHADRCERARLAGEHKYQSRRGNPSAQASAPPTEATTSQVSAGHGSGASVASPGSGHLTDESGSITVGSGSTAADSAAASSISEASGSLPPEGPSAQGALSTTEAAGLAEEPSPTSDPGSGTGWNGFGALSLPGAYWRPYASSSPFNRTTSGDEVDPESAAIVKKILGWGLPAQLASGTAETSEDWSHPVFFAEPGDPTYTLHATEPWGENPLNGIKIGIPAYARPSGSEDAHMTIVTPEGWEYDFWGATKPPAGGGTFTFAWGGRTRIDGSGLESGGTAAGFGNLAGMIREPELAAGHINHALFVVLKCAAKGTGFGFGTRTASSEASSFVYPASGGGSICPAGETAAPPLGARLALAMSPAQIDALNLPQWKKTILLALAEYGGYVGDTGGPGFAFMFESGTSYTAVGLTEPLTQFGEENGLPEWEGHYLFNVASGVEWEKYLRVLVPPSH